MSDSKAMEAEATAVGYIEKAGLSSAIADHAKQGDEETQRYAANREIIIDAATNKKLFWKINRRVLVIMLVTYFCQSLDKGTLNFSSIMGIKDDANLKGQEV
jgi:hypothetical protein